MSVIPERHARYYLERTPSLVWLLLANVAALLVGVRFYVEAMPDVGTFLWPFFLDSPTALFLATLSFTTLVPNLGRRLAAAPRNRALAYLHTFAFVWLVKYGLWTVLALNVGFPAYFPALWDYWAIQLTHLAFVLEAYLIPHYGATTPGALLSALALLLCNDALDYVYGIHPPLRYEPGTALPVGTVALSVLAVFAAARALPRFDADGDE